MEYSQKAISILETAKDLFAEKGFKAVTTKEIAKKAGVNEVTIFRHFENKEKLFEAIIKYNTSNTGVEKFIDPTELDLEKYLTNISKLIQRVFTQNIEIFKIELFERKMMEKKKRYTSMPNTVKNLMTEYLVANHHMTKKKAEVFSVTFMSSIFGLCMNLYFIQNFDPTPKFEDCASLIIEKYM